MTVTTGATAGAAVYQAQIEALKGLASLVEVDEPTFRLLLRSRPHPTIVAGRTGALWFKRSTYLTSYDGFVFVLRSPVELEFKTDAPGAFYVNTKTLSLPTL